MELRTSRQRSRILIVDDDAMVRAALRRVLSIDHAVTTPESAEAALALFRGGHRFDAVLCDLVMRGLDGIALYRECARFAPEQARRFVLMSGGAISPRQDSFLESVDNAFLLKPIDIPELRVHLRRLVDA